MKVQVLPEAVLIFTLCVTLSYANQVLNGVGTQLSNVDIECNSNNIVVSVTTNADEFNGLIYPRGLSDSSSCLEEYEHAGSKITYKLPLRSCNTMSHEVKEGVEYFNTVVIQPHHKLVTNLGRGFTVRCRYQTNNKTLIHGSGISKVGLGPKIEAPALPNCVMKIYNGRPEEHRIAEHVKIGDYLSLVISIDEQDFYGLKVTNCIVRDGLSMSEQPLINNEGCPIDEEILGPFEYSKNLTTAHVTYPAHKFPFTASVYYACNVKLCSKKNGGCDDAPPICDEMGNNVRRRRRKRQSNEVRDRGNLEELKLQDEDVRDRSVEVFSALFVDESEELDEDSENSNSLASTRNEDQFCVSTRRFAVGIAIAGILLSLAVIFLVACIIHRRRRRKGSSTAGSSIYSGPYSNHAYSRD